MSKKIKSLGPSRELSELGPLLESALKQDLLKWTLEKGELSIEIKKSALYRVLSYLRDHKEMQFVQLMDVCGVDWLGSDPRFQVVYHLLSLRHNQRIRVKVGLQDQESIPTVSHIYPSAGWFEREVWDLFGIHFEGHLDLRRILTDYGFVGHPLRKDFPLTGFVEMRYDESQERIVYEPVQLMQAYRNFDFLSPWEGTLPGDEKATKGEGAS